MSNKKSAPKKRRRRSIIAFEMIRLDRAALAMALPGFLPHARWLPIWAFPD
jgi:hypothetical protein